MQVVGGGDGGTNVGAIPSAIWEGPTARIIERRNFDRRTGRRIGPAGPVSSRAAEPRFAKQPAIATAAPTPRTVAARVARPRRPSSAAARGSDLEADDPFQAPPTRTSAPRKWVDPFAE